MCSSFIEKEILRSRSPIELQDCEEISVQGEHGIWANKSEIINWSGPIPISQYKLNEDNQPEHIIKTIHNPVRYTQNISIKYLKPPTLPPHGDLIIKRESDITHPEAPPLIIRQQASRPLTPEPLFIREIPPQRPEIIPQQIITIPSKFIEPPPRKVIIERMPELPPKPQSIIIEKWLPYENQKRRVIFEPAIFGQKNDVKNMVIKWNVPNPVVDREIKYLGVENADPYEYTKRYKNSLKSTEDLPSFVKELKDFSYAQKSKAQNQQSYKLEGDLDALNLLDTNTRRELGITRHFSFRKDSYQSGLYIVELKKNSQTNDFGFVIRGGKEFNMSLYVLRVLEHGMAALDGRLKPGDELIQINGLKTFNMKLTEAVNVILSKDFLSLLVKRTGLPPPTVSDVMDAMMKGQKL